MLRVARTFGLALGLIAALLASQGPEFAQQYAQRLGGAVDELRRVVARLDADAAATGQSRDAAIDRLRADPDRLVQRRGDAARADVERLERLQAQREVLARASGPLERFGRVLESPDIDLGRATWQDYRPAVPATGDGLFAALLGFLAGWGGFRLLTGGVRRLGGLARLRPRRRASVAVS